MKQPPVISMRAPIHLVLLANVYSQTFAWSGSI
jgi:hypothetical protein